MGCTSKTQHWRRCRGICLASLRRCHNFCTLPEPFVLVTLNPEQSPLVSQAGAPDAGATLPLDSQHALAIDIIRQRLVALVGLLVNSAPISYE